MVKVEYNSNISELDRIMNPDSTQSIGAVEKKYIPKIVSPGTPAKLEYPSDYRFDDFLDDEILKKITDFERNNPERIKKWKKEEEERQMDWFMWKRSGMFGNADNNEDSSIREIREIIRICLKYSPNKFVFSVTNQYFKTGKISDKQLQVLTKIANTKTR